MATTLEDILQEQVSQKFSKEDQVKIVGSEPTEKDLFFLLNKGFARQNNLEPVQGLQEPFSIFGYRLGDGEAYDKQAKLAEKQKGLDQAFTVLKGKEIADQLAVAQAIEEQKGLLGEAGSDEQLQFGELNPFSQDIVRSLGGAPTKAELQDITAIPGFVSSERLGPEQAIFSRTEESGHEFGLPRGFPGTGTRAGLTPFGEKAVANDQRILDEIVSPLGGTESAARMADLGLAKPQVEAIVEDPTANVSESILRQAASQIQTNLSQPTLSADNLRAGITATMTATGASPEQIRAVTDTLPSTPTNASVGSQIIQNVASASNARETRLNKFKLRTQAEDTLARRQIAKMQVINDLVDSTSKISGTTVGALKNIEQAQQRNPVSESTMTPEAKAKRATGKAFTRRNQDLLHKEVYTDFDRDQKNQARAELEIARGERELDYAHVEKGFDLALQSAGEGADADEVLENYISAAMESSPSVANQYIDLLGKATDKTDPAIVDGVRNALINRHKDILETSVVMDNIRMINDTELFGDTLKEITSSLEASYVRLAKGDPSKGILPVSPKNLQPMLEQIAKNKELETMSSQNITVTVGADEKPLKIEEAAKIMEVQQSISFIDEVENGLTAEDGSINRGTLAQMNWNWGIEDFNPLTWWSEDDGISLPRGMPFTRGREYAQLLANVAELRGRLKSGAVISKDEWATFLQLYWPSLQDSESGVKAKFSRLRDYATGLMHLVDPTGTQRDRLRGSGTKTGLKKGASRTPRLKRIQEMIDANPNITQEQLNRALLEENY